ncbi:hypothetical protein ACQKIE_01050 [Luteibacter sp. NPDC031894]|uniref:hypothetical protein n=1 Tax=Luteibacter sp. NPDC031894 TaxID=3390572 RepID=UPI003D02BE25
MSIGSFICLSLVVLQLAAQIRAVFYEGRRRTKPPDAPVDPRRAYLDRRSEIERDARRRL